MRLPKSSWSLMVAAVALPACSSTPGYDSTPEAGPTGPIPTISITSPADGSSIVITDDPDVVVRFAVTNFTLRDRNLCNGAPACGHVNVRVDGDGCNDVGVKFNSQGAGTSITAGFDYCSPDLLATPRPHTITLELHYDDTMDSPVLDENGQNVHASIALVVDYRYVDPGDGGLGDAASEGSSPDGATSDAGQGDGGPSDAAADGTANDAAFEAAGDAASDAIVVEATPGDGTTQDGATGEASPGAPEAGNPAADGAADTGSSPDGGTGVDAGPPGDGGPDGNDAGSSTDATTVDAGPG